MFLIETFSIQSSMMKKKNYHYLLQLNLMLWEGLGILVASQILEK